MTITSPWEGHMLEPAFWGCVRWALTEPTMIDRYRSETGDDWEIGRTGFERLIDRSTGAEAAFFQRFSDWVSDNVFGRPENLDEDQP